MKAMLLAAGLGTRMLPLTLTAPKPLLPVLGRAMARQTLRRLGRFGVEQAVLNLHHMPARVREDLGEGGEDGLPRLSYTEEPQLLGTGGGIGNAASHLRGDGAFVVCNGDFLADIDLDAALRQHRASGMLATLVVTACRPGYSVVEIDAAGRIASLAGLPRTVGADAARRALFTGVHIMEEPVLQRIPRSGPSSIVRDVYLDLIEEGKLGSFVHPGFWWEFGSPALYLDGSMKLLRLSPEQRGAIGDFDPVLDQAEARVALGAGAKLDPTASLHGSVALGFAAFVGRGARIQDSIVMPEAWVGPDVRLSRSIVGGGVEVREGFEGDGLVLAQDPGEQVPLPPGCKRQDGILVAPIEG